MFAKKICCQFQSHAYLCENCETKFLDFDCDINRVVGQRIVVIIAIISVPLFF